MTPFSLPRWLPLTLIALAALWWRIHDLDARPMHADEANQAVKLGELLESGRYAFDPHDHHGPTLYYLALPIAWLKGQTTLASLDERTVRLLPAIAGTFSVLLLALLAAAAPPREADNTTWLTLNGPAIFAATFLAVSPPAVYYSRYFVQETLLVTFTLGTFVCAQRWWRRAHVAWAIAGGIGVGLMLATKASAPLFLVAGGLAWLAIRRHDAGVTRSVQNGAKSGKTDAPKTCRPFARDISLAITAALVVAALFYSSFGTHFEGLRDALRVYTFAATRATGSSGHEKPWWYYLQLFAWQREGGLVWEQLAFSALALCGAALALARRFSSSLIRWALVYTAILGLVLSLTPYKTPWHAIHFVPGLSLLAAGALVAIPRWWITILLFLIVGRLQFTQMQLAVFARPADSRNPYAYVHSSPDVTKFRALADVALARSPQAIVRVISREYWPLPWYFRGLTRVGYWETPPDNCDAALVITSEEFADVVRTKLHGSYHETYLGLRPGLLCVVFTPAP